MKNMGLAFKRKTIEQYRIIIKNDCTNKPENCSLGNCIANNSKISTGGWRPAAYTTTINNVRMASCIMHYL
jgi:hypothetical protein